MTVSSSHPRTRRFEPPIRRVLAVDAGTRCVRLLLLESRLHKLRVLRQDALDLQQEGLVSADELQAHLRKLLAQWGRPALALVIPQQVAVSQIVDLPPVPPEQARELLQAETVKLAGVSESAMVHDFVPVPPQAEGRQSFWVTFCQEGEIQNRITQLGLDQEDFREVTTAANALLTAWRATPGHARNAVLVHTGAQATTLVVVRNDLGVFASSFPMGGDFFTRAIARLRRCSPEAAEAAKVSTHLIAGAQALPGFAEIVDGWAEELKRQLTEARGSRRDPDDDPARYPLIASGGAFEMPGLWEHLAAASGMKFERWPLDRMPADILPAMGFEIALGTALQALGLSAQPASLLPASRHEAWRRRLGRQRLEYANTVLLGLCLLILFAGIWEQAALIRHKQHLLTKVQQAGDIVQSNAELTSDLLASYDDYRPVFEREQKSADTLAALAMLAPARSNRNAWFVLVADQQTYFSYPPRLASTNPPVAAPTVDPEEGPRERDATNAAPIRPGLIAELCIPGSAEEARASLGLMVNALKKSPALARVDLLSEDLRRNLADPKVLVPDRHYTLALDFATTEFQAPPHRRWRGLPPRHSLRSSAPGARPADTAEKNTTVP